MSAIIDHSGMGNTDFNINNGKNTKENEILETTKLHFIGFG